MQFFTAPANGQIGYIVGPPAAGSPFNGGIACHPDGRTYVTFNSLITDVWIGGLRVSALGEVFCANLLAPLNFNAGLPSNRGADPLASQFDTANSANDSFVSGGYRVGPLGGVYFTATSPFP